MTSDDARKPGDSTSSAEQPADFDRTKGLDVMTNLTQSHPDADGVFAENDKMALGAITALGGRAGTRVKVVGFDGTPEGIRAVQDGAMNATVAQQPRPPGWRCRAPSRPRAVTGSRLRPRFR